MGLDVRVAGAEKLLRPLDGQALSNIDKLAASIVAVTGVTLGIFVGQDSALCLDRKSTRLNSSH